MKRGSAKIRTFIASVAILLMPALFISGCGAPEVEEGPKDILLTSGTSTYTIEITKINNSEELRINFDLINIKETEHSFTISKAAIVTDRGVQKEVSGIGDSCASWKKMDLSIPRDLYSKARTTYKLCFPRMDSGGTLQIYVKSKDKTKTVTDNLMEGNVMGDETSLQFDLDQYIERDSSDAFSVIGISYDGSISLVIENNDIKDYNKFYVKITRSTGKGEFSHEAFVSKKILQGRRLRIDTDSDLEDRTGRYRLSNIASGDNLTFEFYSGFSDGKLIGPLGSASYIVP